jgi:hypothetical protein
MSEARAQKTPLHLWIVGILALLWSLLGAVDYIMTQTKNKAYMSQFTPERPRSLAESGSFSVSSFSWSRSL